MKSLSALCLLLCLSISAAQMGFGGGYGLDAGFGSLAPTYNKTLPSIVWMAPFQSGGGYCTESIYFVTSLPSYVHIGIRQHGDSVSREFVSGLPSALSSKLQKLMWDGSWQPEVVLCASEPGAWSVPRPNYQTAPCPPRNSKYVIGRTVFETDRIPTGWPERLNNVNEVWVPSPFGVQIFQAAGVTVPIIAMPEPVDTDFFQPGIAPFPLPTSNPAQQQYQFTFLSVFKWEKRKGWDTLIEAFLSEFSGDEAALYIVTKPYHSAGRHPREDIEGIAAGRDVAHIHLLYDVPQAEMPALYNAVGALVQPSRGEGWGRPHQEAMSCGILVIATNWSGNTAFMDNTNSFPVPIAGLELVGEGAFRDHMWATVAPQTLAKVMRTVWRNDDEVKKRARKARRDMVELYSLDATARRVMERLQVVAKILRAKQGEEDGHDEHGHDHHGHHHYH